MKWSEQAWAAALPVYNRIIEMPFIEELAAGTLPQEKFLYYIAQDDLYLHDYAKAMALVAAKNDTPEGTAEWLNFAQIALYSEREMHETFFKNTPAPKAAEMGPACHHYTSFLKSTAALEPAAVGMAAVLPCFWVYKEVGAHIHRTSAQIHRDSADTHEAGARTQETTPTANPYQAWIDTYVGDEFDAMVARAIELCDAAAENSTDDIREKMTRAFVDATRLEFDFWAAGYHLHRW